MDMRIEADTRTLCLHASEFLKRNCYKFPQRVQELWSNFPYASAHAFVCGMESIFWSGDGTLKIGILWEAIDGYFRAPHFPLLEFYYCVGYAREMEFIASLGHIYEFDYLKSQGHDVSEFRRFTIRDCEMAYNEMNRDDMPPLKEDDRNRLKQDLEATKAIIEMLEAGGQRIPGLLRERGLVLERIVG